MARIRTIKPEFWKHEGLCSLPESTHMFAAALLNYADDFGYFNANPGLIKGEIYPLREPSVSIPESIRSLQTDGYIRLGTIDGRRYGHIIAFEDHQRVSHPTPSKISCLPIAWDISGIILDELSKPPETFVPEQGTGNRERNGEQGKDRAAIAPQAPPPPPPPVIPEKPIEPEIPEFLLREPNGKRWEAGKTVPDEWIIEGELKRKAHDLPPVNLRLEAEKFVNYWTSKSGKDATKKDWHATWMNRAMSVEPPRGQPFQREDAKILRVV